MAKKTEQTVAPVAFRGIPVRIMSRELMDSARRAAKVEFRSLDRQVEYWATIGRLVLENPTLTAELIQDTLLGAQEIADGKGMPFSSLKRKIRMRTKIRSKDIWPN